jgi:lipopolysaccharide heptosyltransferase I
VKPSSLGDVVHALPVLHGLRVRFPDSRIDWLIAPSFAPLVEGHGDVDELVMFDRRRFGRLGHNPVVAGEFVRFVGGLRKRRYDLVVDIQGLFRSGFLSLMTGAPVRIGFRSAREGAWIFYTHHIAMADPDAHAVDRYYRVGDLLGFADVPVEFNLPDSEDSSRRAEAMLRESSFPDDGSLIVVAPSARWETKMWLTERFARTIDRLCHTESRRCVLVGGADERGRCERIAERCRTRPANLAGQTSLSELTAVVRRADLVLCHDSAVAHLAAALQRRLVCITGPTNPRRTGPYRRGEDVVRLNLECSPCYLRKLRQCRHDHRCMKELEVEAVVAASERALERRQGNCRLRTASYE